MNNFSIRTPADPLPHGAHRKGRRYPHLSTSGSSGSPIVTVPLAGGQLALVDARDFKRLMDDGVSDQWVLNRDGKPRKDGSYHWYVRAMRGDEFTMVARLILSDPTRERVRYRDGNPLNLRRANLYSAALYQVLQE